MDRTSTVIIVFGLAFLAIINGFAITTYLNETSSDDPEPGYIVLTDVCGREVQIPEDVSKVVCIAAGSLRLVSYMGADEMVVGIDSTDSSGKRANDYATYLLAYDYSGVPNVGDANNETSYKAIMESGAELIIASKPTAEELDTIQKMTGIPVLGINAGGDISVLDDVFAEDVMLVGKAIGAEVCAKELLDSVEAIIDDLGPYGSASDGSKAFIGGLTYYRQSSLYMTTGNFVPFDLIGISNVMPYMSGLPYNIEIPSRIVEASPDYIFIDCMNKDGCTSEYKENKTLLDLIPAIKNGDDYLVFASKYYGTNWETELMNAYLIGYLADPESFDYDIEDKLNDVLGAFFPGSDIDVDDICSIQGWDIGEEWL